MLEKVVAMTVQAGAPTAKKEAELLANLAAQGVAEARAVKVPRHLLGLSSGQVSIESNTM